MNPKAEKITDRVVLLAIVVGCVAILLAVVAGIVWTGRRPGELPLPNWAENVLVALSTAVALILKEALSTLVALASGKQVATLGTQLANAGPPPTPISDTGEPAPIPVKIDQPKDEAIPVKSAEGPQKD